jgi:hypothetical protein
MPPGGWGGLGGLVFVGSVVVNVCSQLLATLVMVERDQLGVLGIALTPIAAFTLMFGLWAIPFLVYRFVARHARRVYGATDRELRQVALVAAVLYGVHLPLIGFLWVIMNMTGWPWR